MKTKVRQLFGCGFMTLRKDADVLCCCCAVVDALMATLLPGLLQLLLLLRGCFLCYCCCSYKTHKKKIAAKGDFSEQRTGDGLMDRDTQMFTA